MDKLKIGQEFDTQENIKVEKVDSYENMKLKKGDRILVCKNYLKVISGENKGSYFLLDNKKQKIVDYDFLNIVNRITAKIDQALKEHGVDSYYDEDEYEEIICLAYDYISNELSDIL